MSKVIQIRDVRDDVHDALTKAAAERGMSLTKYLNAELEHLARIARIVENNAQVVRRSQRRVRGAVTREAILDALRESRGE